MAAATRNVKARVMVITLRLEKECLPACPNESFRNGKIPKMTRRMETRSSLLLCCENKCPPACLDEDLCDL